MFTVLLFAAIIIASASAVGGSVFWAAQKKKSLPNADRPQLAAGTPGTTNVYGERGFDNLLVGDIVQYNTQDFLVEGVIKYDEAGHRWSMAKIVDVEEVHWLLQGLERSSSDKKRLLQSTDEIDLKEYPSEILIVGKQRYQFEKRGTATAQTFGDTGTLSGRSGVQATGAGAERCRWWVYQAEGGKLLLVEQWGDDYRILLGDTVGATDLEMMPGS